MVNDEWSWIINGEFLTFARCKQCWSLRTDPFVPWKLFTWKGWFAEAKSLRALWFRQMSKMRRWEELCALTGTGKDGRDRMEIKDVWWCICVYRNREISPQFYVTWPTSGGGERWRRTQTPELPYKDSCVHTNELTAILSAEQITACSACFHELSAIKWSHYACENGCWKYNGAYLIKKNCAFNLFFKLNTLLWDKIQKLNQRILQIYRGQTLKSVAIWNLINL